MSKLKRKYDSKGKNGVNISVYLPVRLLARVRAICRDKGVSISRFITDAVKCYINDVDKNE